MIPRFDFSVPAAVCSVFLQNTKPDRRRWQPLIISRFLLGLCLCLATSCGSSTTTEKKNLSPLHEAISSSQQSNNKGSAPSRPRERPSPKTSRTDNSTAMRPDKNSTELVFKIVALHKNVNQFLDRPDKKIDQASSSAQRSLDSTLQQNFSFYRPGSVRVDLRQNRLSLRSNAADISDLVRKMNEVCYQMVTIAPLDETLRETLAAESGEDSLVKQELHYFIHKISPEYQTQVDQNFQIGSEALRLILNERFKNEVPEYVPGSLVLDLEYKKLTFEVITYPSQNLGVQINSLYQLPVSIGAKPYRTIEQRTDQQLKPSQVTYEIVGIADFHERAMEDQYGYNFWRRDLIRTLTDRLETGLPGYVPDTLDVNLVKKTITFQLDHTPDHRVSDFINNKSGDQLASVKFKVLAEPVLVEDPGPVYRTPNRPMKRVVLKILLVEKMLVEKFKRPQSLLATQLQDIYRHLDDYLGRGVDGYIGKSVGVDFEAMQLSFLIDRVPPDDLTKMVNGIRFLDLDVDQELVSVEDFEYDPQASEKTMYFSFVNRGQKLPQFDKITQKHVADGNLGAIEGYIPGSLKMDYDQGTFNIRVRVVNEDASDIEAATTSLARIKIECNHLKTILPESSGTGNPLQPGMTAKQSAEPALVKENVKVTVKYGLYGGRATGKPQKSARDALDGFSWIDLKTLQFDVEKKEFSFETTGPFNRGALERSLKRQKFYQCVISHETLTKKEEPKEE
ncbi:hypothetical protein [Gimesia algae]|uniref:Uncharacterized protein n=1 Tax=Gimesia algae TaxID=2527971 RepID=A0A517VL72_9PLAN|nr:hypothetical protein [Gimesia algae]QDT93705.1 hypothetical protein Pan161_53880 [Gimesia algae]